MTAKKGYTPTATKLYFEQDEDSKNLWMQLFMEVGGWNPDEMKLVPLTVLKDKEEDVSVTSHALDSIAAAAELGVLDRENFVRMAFATFNDFEAFRAQLLAYSEGFWLNDRHANAFMTLDMDESSIRNFEALAEALSDFE